MYVLDPKRLNSNNEPVDLVSVGPEMAVVAVTKAAALAMAAELPKVAVLVKR